MDPEGVEISFENAAARGPYFAQLTRDAERVRLQLLQEHLARKRQSLELFDKTRAGVLTALRRGLPKDLERRVDDAPAMPDGFSMKALPKQIVDAGMGQDIGFEEQQLEDLARRQALGERDGEAGNLS